MLSAPSQQSVASRFYPPRGKKKPQNSDAIVQASLFFAFILSPIQEKPLSAAITLFLPQLAGENVEILFRWQEKTFARWFIVSAVAAAVFLFPCVDGKKVHSCIRLRRKKKKSWEKASWWFTQYARSIKNPKGRNFPHSWSYLSAKIAGIVTEQIFSKIM